MRYPPKSVGVKGQRLMIIRIKSYLLYPIDVWIGSMKFQRNLRYEFLLCVWRCVNLFDLLSLIEFFLFDIKMYHFQKI